MYARPSVLGGIDSRLRQSDSDVPLTPASPAALCAVSRIGSQGGLTRPRLSVDCIRRLHLADPFHPCRRSCGQRSGTESRDRLGLT